MFQFIFEIVFWGSTRIKTYEMYSPFQLIQVPVIVVHLLLKKVMSDSNFVSTLEVGV